MKIQNILIAAFVSSLLFSSCKKVLDKVDQSKGHADLVFSDSTLAKQNIDYIYDQCLPTWFGNDGGAIYTASGSVSGMSDESYGDNKFLQGTIVENDVADIGTANSNNNYYFKIRTINTFLRDCAAGTIATPTKNRFLAQAYFFRAFKFFSLVRVYGGIPLILTPLSSVGDENKAEDLVPRSKTSDCIKQITSDLDSAIKYLPKKWPNTADWGRITSGAAAAFKGRVLLYWASPEFNPTNDMTRWQAAYDASTQAVSLLSSAGFGLFSTGTNPYQNMWFTEVNNPEAVMVTGYNTSTGTQTLKSNGYDKSVVPASLSGGGASQPSWDFAQLYPMKDGKSIYDKTSAYTYNYQYFMENRDPRFAATIAYNGAPWSVLNNPNYKLWTYLYYNNKPNTTPLTTKSTEATTPNTTTGFYLRKAVNPSEDATTINYSGTDWMEIRYAEVLLNQAEAAAELGRLAQGQEAYTNLIAIRKRAGIDAGTGLYGLASGMSHDAMINSIMLERAIEQAFEGHRFWDLRRRNLLLPTLNNKKVRHGVVITTKNTNLGTDYIAATRDASDLHTLYTTTFVVDTTKSLDTKYNLNWQAKYNFFAIPTTTITSDPKILQTLGWTNGSFDPLQ